MAQESPSEAEKRRIIDAPQRRWPRRRWRWRVAAILLGVSPLLVGEAALRMTAWKPALPVDPFVGFAGLQPLFVPDPDDAKSLITNPQKRLFFRPQRFPKEKPADEFRIFCLGGSTVQGRPFEVETSFTNWLQWSLNAGVAPQERSATTYRVVNCGGISYASYRLIPILDEVLEYSPDLILICTGQNEFLEARTYEGFRDLSPSRVAVRRQLGKLKAFQWIEERLRSPPAATKNRQQLSSEVDALLDYQGGLSEYHRDRQWSRGVQEHYVFNIEAMAARCHKHGIPMLFLLPVCNLVDTPPFKSEHGEDVSPREREQFQAYWQQSLDPSMDDLTRLAAMRRAVELDPHHAAAQFRLGKLLQAAGRWQEAEACFVRARDEDICPLRMLTPMYEQATRTLAQWNVPQLDLRQVIREANGGRPPGDRWMIDHVHPTIHGHQIIAMEIHQRLIQLAWVPAVAAGFEQRRDDAFQKQLADLDEAYFARGRAKLEGLRLWTEGRAKKERVEQ